MAVKIVSPIETEGFDKLNKAVTEIYAAKGRFLDLASFLHNSNFKIVTDDSEDLLIDVIAKENLEVYSTRGNILGVQAFQGTNKAQRPDLWLETRYDKAILTLPLEPNQFGYITDPLSIIFKYNLIN